MPATFERGPLEGLIIVRPTIFRDERGFFVESYKKSEYQNAGINLEFVQDNHSFSVRGVIRGLHFQRPPFEQGKLVRVLKGRVLDVAVDIRSGSSTFGNYFSIELDESSGTMLYLPPGFAHGFLALTDDVHLMYKCTAEYNHKTEQGIVWNDPQIGIKWPVADPIVSQKDRLLPRLSDSAVLME